MRKVNSLNNFAAAAILAGGLLLPVSSAVAKDRPVVVTAPTDVANLIVRRVSYADLDLALPAGEAALNDRVGFAIGDVCAEANLFDNGSFAFKSGMMKCSGSAWAGARPQIDRAVRRARDIAATGVSTVPAVAISITASR